VPGKAKPSKLPFYISRRDGLPFTLAGLWEKWKDGILSCTILTCEACDGIRDLHTRMPVILARGSNPKTTTRVGVAIVSRALG
jgi:putative SOS response-associated peptidase YedK